ncbi:TPR_REGION domain-containing protein [Haematococcus lacustris]|uniref:TPR_REGION domain-containing protein n=1 Tax=Haematococcus lacustris TaxID=44745 RepID=A0A699YTJ6_HAELA|nr:TPR_REGION domain-containing protein [Haematococcus lacustris]
MEGGWKLGEEWGGGVSIENPHVQRLSYCKLIEADLLQRLPSGRGHSVTRDVTPQPQPVPPELAGGLVPWQHNLRNHPAYRPVAHWHNSHYLSPQYGIGCHWRSNQAG